MKAAQFAAAAAALGLLSACDDSIVGRLAGGKSTEPGAIVQRDFPTGAFTKIELGAPADVEVRADGPLAIKATGGQNFINQFHYRRIIGHIFPKRRGGMSFGRFECPYNGRKLLFEILLLARNNMVVHSDCDHLESGSSI